MADAVSIRCHRCKAWLGESIVPLKLIGLFQSARDRHSIEEREYSWRCKGCGWTNVFERRSWREVEIKSVDESTTRAVG